MDSSSSALDFRCNGCPLYSRTQIVKIEGTFRTVCPRNCYCTCGMLVTVRNGCIVDIEGDPRNPATEGKVCLKGISYAPS